MPTRDKHSAHIRSPGQINSLVYKLMKDQQLLNTSTYKLTSHQLASSLTPQLTNTSTHEYVNSRIHQRTNLPTHQLTNFATHKLFTSKT